MFAWIVALAALATLPACPAARWSIRPTIEPVDLPIAYDLEDIELVCADADGDRCEDVFAMSPALKRVIIFGGNRDAVIQPRGEIALPFRPVWLGVRDIDGDGVLDLVLLGSDRATILVVFLDSQLHERGRAETKHAAPILGIVFASDRIGTRRSELVVIDAAGGIEGHLLLWRGGALAPAGQFSIPGAGAPVCVAASAQNRDGRIRAWIATSSRQLHEIELGERSVATTKIADLESVPAGLAVGRFFDPNYESLLASYPEEHRTEVITVAPAPVEITTNAIAVRGEMPPIVVDANHDGRDDVISFDRWQSGGVATIACSEPIQKFVERKFTIYGAPPQFVVGDFDGSRTLRFFFLGHGPRSIAFATDRVEIERRP